MKRKATNCQMRIRITGGELRGREILSPGVDSTHPMGAREKLALFNMLAGEITGARVLDAYAGSGALGIEALSRGANFVVFVEKSPKVAEIIRQNLQDLQDLGLENTEVKVATVGNFVGEECNGEINGELRDNTDTKEASDTEKDRGDDKNRGDGKDNRESQLIAGGEKFDLILADPPYDDFDLTEVEELTKVLKYGGILVLSHPGEGPELTGMELVFRKRRPAEFPGEGPELTGMELLKTKKYAGARISEYQKTTRF